MLHAHADERNAGAAFATAAMRSPITGHVYLRGDTVIAQNRRFMEMVRSERGPWQAGSGPLRPTLLDVVRAQSGELRKGAEVVRHTRADGERVVEVRTEQIGEVPSRLVAATVFDVTAVANAARAAEAARSSAKVEALQETSRRKDEFLGMLSHELRNPLAPIRNCVYILGRVDPASDQARRAQEVLQRQVTHLARLVDDLLDVTRIERGRFEVHRGDLDLCQVVRLAAEDHRSVLQQRGIALEVDIPGKTVHVDADAGRIAQVVGNLLHNAAKFTKDGGQVTVSLSRLAGAAEVSVRDTGVGMDADLVQHVFEPFTQARQSLARTGGGLGLGLALVKGVVEMHGGTVHAASDGPGKGSEFVVRLPLARQTVEVGEAGRPPASPDVTSSRSVLVVEDNPDAAASLAEIVKMFGHHVQVAYDGPTALKIAGVSRPEVVLCDVGLPGMSGYEVAQALRARGGPGPQLIAVTGYARPDDVTRAMDAGFDAHVAKPLDPEKIERLLARPPPPGASR
ncbi:MAG TPA: ATP-binding protein [Anaeromyxobacteraceae bacterium]|nr:ATP-binding protein [Anaeromyxobacteraceae bacterium]